jgi:gliding motility-associated lipoprotein GldD
MIRWELKVFIIILIMISFSCKRDAVPRPRGYFRIDFPVKNYVQKTTECSFSIEIPDYAQLVKEKNVQENCWYNIEFPKYKATIYLTYKEIQNDNLSVLTEDIRKLAYKHIVKADDIEEKAVSRVEENVYGLVYKISGNTASNISFYLTDSSTHFLSGSLYFEAQPNKDSLAPAIQFFGEDVVHLTESLSWNK